MGVYYVCGKCRTPVIYSPSCGETDTHECPKVERSPLTPTEAGAAAGLAYGVSLVVLAWVLG